MESQLVETRRRCTTSSKAEHRPLLHVHVQSIDFHLARY